MWDYLTQAASMLLLIGGSSFAGIAEPVHTVIKQQGDYEIREYAPMVIAEVIQKGDRADAIGAGFRPLADYIFGENAPGSEIAMTAPVIQERQGREIAMTAPVTQEAASDGIWKIRFVMPADWTLATLPKPVNPEIKLLQMSAERRAVVRFSGLGRTNTLEEKTAELKAFIAAEGLVADGEPVLAFYDPPWTLPFLRRNEVMLRVKTSS
jgi:hypothetical protein